MEPYTPYIEAGAKVMVGYSILQTLVLLVGMIRCEKSFWIPWRGCIDKANTALDRARALGATADRPVGQFTDTDSLVAAALHEAKGWIDDAKRYSMKSEYYQQMPWRAFCPWWWSKLLVGDLEWAYREPAGQINL